MSDKLTDDELYLLLSLLSTGGPKSAIREAAVRSMMLFTAEKRPSRIQIPHGVLGAPGIDEPVPRHKALVKLEDSAEARALVKALEAHSLAKGKEDPTFTCRRNYRECLKTGDTKRGCMVTYWLCMLRVFMPKKVSLMGFGSIEKQDN